jgi:hypothetical protein
MPRQSRLALLIVSIALWGGGIGFGQKVLRRYALAAGEVGEVRSDWPSESRLLRAQDGRSTALLFLHPKCPCSEASVAELDSFMAQTGARAKVLAVFVQPPGWRAEAVQGALWNQAKAIPGVETRVDWKGEEARRFGALTSGHFFLYRPNGELVFQGGITPSRGHRGDNPGRATAVNWVVRGNAEKVETKPFGCALFSSVSDAATR